MKHISPSLEKTAFNCPRCGVLAKQYWCMTGCAKVDESPGTIPLGQRHNLIFIPDEPIMISERPEAFSGSMLQNLFLSQCSNCWDFAIWRGINLIYPSRTLEFSPNPDLSDAIKKDFIEAAGILYLSPRGAAALLRLGIQKLCIELGLPGKNINDDIAALVKRGLPSGVQQALDVLRVIGNEAVHPGTLDLSDDIETVQSLFEIVNFIAEKMISEPNKIKAMFDSLPENKRLGIEQRDSPPKLC